MGEEGKKGNVEGNISLSFTTMFERWNEQHHDVQIIMIITIIITTTIIIIYF